MESPSDADGYVGEYNNIYIGPRYLFRMTRPDLGGYDTYDSCIVCAANEEAARKIHPSGGNYPPSFMKRSWVCDPARLKVELLGVAVSGTPSGVLLASFVAG